MPHKSKLRIIVTDILNIPDDAGRAPVGAKRSPKWPAVQRQYLVKYSECAVCEKCKDIEVHHILPFHLFPDHELLPENLISLCRTHHFLFGHLSADWSCFNPLVRADAEIWRFRLRAAKTLMRLARKQAEQKT